MAKNIESNLIIRSKLPAPTGTGLKTIRSELEQIDKLLSKIERTVTIKLNVQGQQTLANLLKKTGGGAGGAGGAFGGFGPGGAGGAGGRPSRGAITRVEQVSSTGRQRVSETFEATRAGQTVRRTETQRISPKGEVTDEVRTSTTDLAADRLAREQRRVEKQVKEARSTLQSAQRDFTQRREQFLKGGFEEISRSTKNFELVRGTGERASASIFRLQRVLADGRKELVTFDERAGSVNNTIKETAGVARGYEQRLNLVRNAQIAANNSSALMAQGFQVHRESFNTIEKGGRKYMTTLTELRRVSGSPIFGNLAIEIAKVDSATGKMTATTIRGAEAIRLMGDNFVKAVAKVALWYAATSAIYFTARAAGEASKRFLELEANTVFLARVGERIAGDKADFETRLKLASQLTKSLIDQGKILGATGREAQQAAATFLRGQQTQQQALKATIAAMLASTIAELDLAEAGELLSAAQAQFKLSSDQLLSTLNALNTLSNVYRVTTDDLLQSISRSGSVYADVNGRLEGLAATTAIVAQRTRRSGAEIGNALKTIISRLSAPETSGALLETVGVTLSNQQGQLKNFTELLLELQVAMGDTTEAEKNRIAVQIAGARQVNILKNALDGVIDIVLAEVTALRQESSAYEEAAHRATTLEAALGRLSANFDDIVQSGAGAGEVLTHFVNTISVILKLLNVFDGLLVKVGLVVIAFTAVRIAMAFYTKQAVTTTVANQALAASYIQVSTSAAGTAVSTSAAASGLIGGISKLNVVAALLTASITLVIYAIGKWEEASVKAQLAAQQRLQQMNDEIGALERQRRATGLLTNALIQLVEQQRSLNDARAAGKPVDPARERQVADDIRRVAEAEGIKVTDEELQNNKELNLVIGEILTIQKERFDFEIANRKDIIKLTREEIGEIERQIEVNKKEVVSLRERAAVAREVLKEPIAALNFSERANELEQETKKAQLNLVELQATIRESEITLQGVIDASRQLPQAFNDFILNQIKQARGYITEFDRFKKSSAAAGQLSTGNFGEQADLKRRGQVLGQIQKGLSEKLANIVAAPGTQGYREIEKFKEQLVEVTQAMEALALAAKAKEIEGLKNLFGTRLDIAGSVEKVVALQKVRIGLAQRVNEPGVERFENVDILEKEISFERQKALALQQLLNDIPKRQGLSNEKKVALGQAVQEKVQEHLVNARELELKLLGDIFTLEIEITKEKQKQQKEIQKAIGLLETEQKIFLLGELQRPGGPPARKLTFEEQFFNPAERNKLLQQFLPGRLQQGLDPANPFDKLFIDNQVGIEADIIAAEDKLKKFFDRFGRRPVVENGRVIQPGIEGRENFPRVQHERALGALDIENRLAGGPGIDAEQRAADAEFIAGRAKDLNLNVRVDAFDFNPLVDAFRDAVVNQFLQFRNDIVGQVREIWGVVNNHPAFQNDLPPIQLPDDQ